MVVHLGSSGGGSDLVMALHHSRGEDVVGELVAVLSHQFTKVLSRDLDVRVSNQLTASQKNKVRGGIIKNAPSSNL